MAAKSTRKLSDFTIHAVHADGSSGSVRAAIHVETTGAMQLFTPLPAHLLSSGVAARCADHSRARVTDGRLYARDPKEIKQLLGDMYNSYRKLLLEQQREKVIVVAFQARIPGDHHNSRHDFSFVAHEFVLALDLEIRWRSGGRMFEFREDDDCEMHSTREPLAGAKVIPYTDEAWRALTSIQETLMAGTARLRTLLASDELPALLLAGPGAQALLAGPVDT